MDGNLDQTSCVSKDQPQLDFESEQFDPEAILNADLKALKIPEPKAKTYNHLEEYERKSGALQLGLIVKEGISPAPGNDSRIPKDANTQAEDRLTFNKKQREAELKKTLVPNLRIKRDQKTVLTQMNANVSGPLGFLFKCVNQRVKVVIRRRKIIFQHHDQVAHLYGKLIAFDKHCNLILGDVIERVNLKTDGANESEVSHNDIPKNVRRDLKTIFIRGANVLTVSLETIVNDGSGTPLTLKTEPEQS